MILSGIGISIGANAIGVIPVVYGGLAIMGLGVISVSGDKFLGSEFVRKFHSNRYQVSSVKDLYGS